MKNLKTYKIWHYCKIKGITIEEVQVENINEVFKKMPEHVKYLIQIFDKNGDGMISQRHLMWFAWKRAITTQLAIS